MDTYTDIASNIREVQYLLQKMRNEIDCCRKATLTVKTHLRELATALAEEEVEKRHMAAQDDSVPLLDSDLVPEKTTLEATSVLEMSSPFEPELTVTHMMVKVSSEVFHGNFSLFFLPQNIEAGRTAVLRLGGIYCPQPVCENDSVGFTSTFVTKMAFVGSCPTQPFKVVLIHLKPPAKPPDRFINMRQMLDSHMISKLLSTSHKYVILLHGLKGVFVVERSDFDLLSLVKSEHLNTWISSLHTQVLSIDFSSLNKSVKPKGVEKAIELEFGVPFSIFLGYLHLCISYVGENSLQTFFQSSDVRWTFITSHSILCRSNDVQIIWSWFGKPFWLPTDDTSYFILSHKWLTKVGNLVLKYLDMADFTFLLKHDELILFDFAHKINGRQRIPCLHASSGLEVFLIVLDPITRRLNLNSIYKHVMVHVLWFDGAHGDKLYVKVVIALCPGALSNTKSAKKIHSDHDVAAIHGVLLHMLHFCRYPVVKHTDLKLENYLMTSNMVEDMLLEATDFGEPLFIEDVLVLVVAGRVGYFEVHSTNFDQPLNTVWPEEVRFKVSAKFLFYDIIIIEAMTEGTSPSNFRVAFGTVGVSKTTSKFTLKVHKWATETSPMDSQATNIYLKQFIWQGSISQETESVIFQCFILFGN